MDHHGSVRRLWTIFSYSQTAEGVSNNLIFSFAAVGAVSGLASAFILPWFPNVCREQGLSRWQTGLIFASLDGTLLVCRWPLMKVCKRVGIRRFFFFGFGLQAAACFGLGWSWAITEAGFFTTCLVLRAIQGFGASMVSVASLQVMNTLIYLNVGSVSTCMEACVGLARVFGAPCGAVVYHSFGGGSVALKMSFWFLSALFAGAGIVSSGTIQLPCEPPALRVRDPGQPTAWVEMFCNGNIAASLLAIFLVDFITASLEPTLSIHLFEFYEMGVWDRGLCFLEMGIFGLFAAPVASLVGEYTSRKMLMVVGFGLTAMAVVGLGSGSDSNVASGFAIMLGMSMSCVAIPALPALLWDVPEDSQLTDGEVARVTNALGAIAAVMGAIYGSGLATVITFHGMTLVTAGILTLYVAILMVSYAVHCLPWRNPAHEPSSADADPPASLFDPAAAPLLKKETDVQGSINDKVATFHAGTLEAKEEEAWLPSFGKQGPAKQGVL